MSDKELYRKFCEENDELIHIYIKPWWMDAVSGNNWDVVLAKKGDVIQGVWVFQKSKKYGFTLLNMPKLSTYQGLWFNYPPAQKANKIRSFEKKVFDELYSKLPEFDYLNQRMHYSLENWLPLYWKGFTQTTGYTYLIPDLTDTEKLWGELDSRIRRAIKKASNRFNVRVEQKDDIELFYQMNVKTFERQDEDPGYDLGLVKRIDDACKRNRARKMFFAYDDKDNIHAAVYLIYDSKSAYYIMGGSDPEYRNSEANSLLMWEAVKDASASGYEVFDFEGSMIEPIEKFVGSFGTRQTPYFKIRKVNNPILGLLKR